MGIYSNYIFPRLMNLSMSAKMLIPYRTALLQAAQGAVLEIGFGSGLNLPYYPAGIQQLHTVEVNEGMKRLAQKNLNDAPIEVFYHQLDAQQLPFPDHSFDTVVSTWTLCSIANVAQALREVYRVVKPEGKFLFVEHGLSPEPRVQRWQHRLTPIQRLLADGCHLNRDMEALILAAGFRFGSLQKEYAAGVSKLGGYFYLGTATK